MTTGYKILAAIGVIAIIGFIYWMITKNKNSNTSSDTGTGIPPRTTTSGRNIQCPPGEVFGFDSQSNTFKCHKYSYQ